MNLKRILSLVGVGLAIGFTWCLDMIIEISLRVREGERAVRPTRRIRFSPELKGGLHRDQVGRCMYCGRAMGVEYLHIDHRNPVDRGGSNEVENLQLLCPPCNTLKSNQTDQEFRSRFRSVLAGRTPGPRQPPIIEIPREEFRAAVERTSVPTALQQHRKSKFVTPRAKINSGGVVAGAIVGGVWLFGIALLAGEFISPTETILTYIALIGGGMLWAAMWYSVTRRAKETGRYDE